MPVTMNEVLLRGTTIKNSGNVHGLVIYTGPESRIQMNAARPPKKTGVLRATLLGMRRTVSGRVSLHSCFYGLGILMQITSGKLLLKAWRCYTKHYNVLVFQTARHSRKRGCLISFTSGLAVQGHLTRS